MKNFILFTTTVKVNQVTQIILNFGEFLKVVEKTFITPTTIWNLYIQNIDKTGLSTTEKETSVSILSHLVPVLFCEKKDTSIVFNSVPTLLNILRHSEGLVWFWMVWHGLAWFASM